MQLQQTLDVPLEGQELIAVAVGEAGGHDEPPLRHVVAQWCVDEQTCSVQEVQKNVLTEGCQTPAILVLLAIGRILPCAEVL